MGIIYSICISHRKKHNMSKIKINLKLLFKNVMIMILFLNKKTIYIYIIRLFRIISFKL